MPASSVSLMEARALHISSHSLRTSQRSESPSLIGWFGKRWTSSTVRSPACRRASTARPLSAPRSNARYDLDEVPLGIRRDVVGVAGGAFLCDALEVAALPESLHWIFGQCFGIPPGLNCRANIGGESILQDRFGFYQIAILLSRGEGACVNEDRFREKLLSHSDRLNHGFDLAFQIMTLIHHVRDIRTAASLPLEELNFVEDAKDLIRIDGTQRQIIVGITPIVEMEAAEHVFGEEPCNDLLDVLRGVVMSGIDQNFGL